MKTTIKLVFLYFAFQIAGVMLGSFGGFIYTFATTGTISVEGAQASALAPSLFLGMLFMTIYLWKAGYISREKVTWSIVSPGYLTLSLIMYAGVLILIDLLMSYMDWLPNLMESSFEQLQSNWLGILSIAVFGPILEELLFRGAITRALLAKYNPRKAIIISALVFGIFHLNPVQIVSASLIGLLLGWIYYKTASLIPCILIHVANNSLSVWISAKYPGVENMRELMGDSTFSLVAIGAVIVFAGGFYLMNKTTISYPWRIPKPQISEEKK